jgi:hypothetical protein
MVNLNEVVRLSVRVDSRVRDILVNLGFEGVLGTTADEVAAYLLTRAVDDLTRRRPDLLKVFPIGRP